jgi:hypothetical protein
LKQHTQKLMPENDDKELSVLSTAYWQLHYYFAQKNIIYVRVGVRMYVCPKDKRVHDYLAKL